MTYDYDAFHKLCTSKCRKVLSVGKEGWSITLQKSNHKGNYSSLDVPDSDIQLLCNRPESAALLESENWTDLHCSDALLCWGFFAMSLATILTAVCTGPLPLLVFKTKYSSPSLLCSSSLAAPLPFIYRGHLALKPACPAACRDRAVAASLLWLSSSTIPCQPFLPVLSAESGKGEKMLSMRPICHVP